jgi:hypothetical protein
VDSNYYPTKWSEAGLAGDPVYSTEATLKVGVLLKVEPIKLNEIAASGVGSLVLEGSNTLRTTVTTIDPGSLKLAYQWRRNGAQISSGTVGAFATSGAESTFELKYLLPFPVNSDLEGVYDVIVDNGAMVAASPSINVTVDPKILSLEIPSNVNPSDPVRMTASFTGKAGTYRYQWLRNGVPLSGVTESEGPVSSIFNVYYNIPAVQTSGTHSGGTYKVRVFGPVKGYVDREQTMNVAKAAAITAQPAANVRFSATSGFTISAKAEGDGLKYQWIRNGTPLVDNGTLTGTTTGTLTLAGSGSSNSAELQQLVGLYQLKVSNEFSEALSSVVNVSLNKELEVQDLKLETVDIGGSANLIVNAAGPGELSYKWYKQNQQADSWTQVGSGESHRISPVSVTDAGTYKVEVVSSENPNSPISKTGTLSVRDVPRILVAPVSRIVGGSGTTSSKVSFKVVAESRAGGTLSFDWGNVGTYTSNGNTSTLIVTVPTGSTSSESTYSVKVSSGESADGKVQSASITLEAKLTVLPSTQTKDKITTAGSDGVSVHTGWWVYWVKAKKSDGSSRNGYYALEREYKDGVVTPKRAVWVWQPQDATALASTYPKDDWLEGDQSVVDAVASERGEFSVLASRIASGTVGTNNYVASGDYAIAGRVEEEGEGSLYGAPDFVEGVYSDSTGEYTVELSWDMEQVYRLDLLGSDLSRVTQELQDALQDALLNGD